MRRAGWILVAIMTSLLIAILISFTLAGGRLSLSFPSIEVGDPVVFMTLAAFALGSVTLAVWRSLRTAGSRSLLGPLGLSLAASLAVFVIWVPFTCASGSHGPPEVTCQSLLGLTFSRVARHDELLSFAQAMLLAPIATFISVWLRLRYLPLKKGGD